MKQRIPSIHRIHERTRAPLLAALLLAALSCAACGSSEAADVGSSSTTPPAASMTAGDLAMGGSGNAQPAVTPASPAPADPIAESEPVRAADGGAPPMQPAPLEEIPPAKQPCPAGAPRPEPGEKPNFVWIVSEDNSPYLGAYGDGVAETPNIDRLAGEGVTFENAFAPFPVCAPTRFAMFTGVNPVVAGGSQDMRNRVQELPESVRGWPQYLREAGYYTVNNGKTDYNHDVGDRERTAWDASGGGATFRNRPAGKPFFASFNFMASHESSIFHGDRPRTPPSSVQLPPYHPDVPAFREDWARYYDAIRDMDAEVGKIVQQLQGAGVYEDTIIFYFSDHGGILPRSKRFIYDSGTHVPLVVRVPERWCHILPAPAGDSTDRLVSLVDLGPTLLKIAGAELPGHLSGQPFLDIDHAAQREFVILARRRMDEQMDLVRSIRTRKWQYVRNFYPFRPAVSFVEYMYRTEAYRTWDRLHRAGELNPAQDMWFQPRSGRELFSVDADPHQIRNLATDPQYETTMQTLDGMLRKWMLEQRDTGFAPEGMPSGVDFETRDDPQRYPLAELIELAFAGSDQDPTHLPLLVTALDSPHPMLRYWAAVGLASLGEAAGDAHGALVEALDDEQALVQVAAAEALVAQGSVELGRSKLEQRLVDVQHDPMEKLHVGQAYVTFETQLANTPQSVFQSAQRSNNNDYTNRRLKYLMGR